MGVGVFSILVFVCFICGVCVFHLWSLCVSFVHGYSIYDLSFKNHPIQTKHIKITIYILVLRILDLPPSASIFLKIIHFHSIHFFKLIFNIQLIGAANFKFCGQYDKSVPRFLFLLMLILVVTGSNVNNTFAGSFHVLQAN